MVDRREGAIRGLVDRARRARGRSGGTKVGPLLDEAERLLSVSPELEGWAVRVRIERGRFEYQRHDSDRAMALRLLDAALVDAERLGDPVLEAFALRERGRLLEHSIADNLADMARARAIVDAMVAGGHQSPYDVSTAKVAMMIAHSCAVILARNGRSADRLEVLSWGRSTPGAMREGRDWIQLTRMAAVTALSLANFDEHARLLAELEEAFPSSSTNAKGARAAAERLRGAFADRMGDFEAAIRHYEAALELLDNPTKRGNVTNLAALCAIHHGDLDRADLLLDQAENHWSDHGRALVGRSITLRHRSRIAAAREDFHQAFELVAEVLNQVASSLPAARGTLAWMVDLMVAATRAGFDASGLRDVVIERVDAPISCDDWDGLVELALAVVGENPDAVTWHRALNASARLWFEGAISLVPERERLEQSHEWSVVRQRWATASGTSGVLAEFIVRTGGEQAADDAYVWAKRAIEEVQRTRARIDGEFDRMRVARDRREVFLLAWELAGRRGDGEEALRIAEAARGTALQRLLFQDLESQASSIAGAMGVLEDENPDVEGPEEDEGAPGEPSADRAGAFAVLGARMTDQLRALSQVLPRLAYPEPVDPAGVRSRLGDRLAVHLDLDRRGRVHAVCTSGDGCWVAPPVQLDEQHRTLLLELASEGEEVSTSRLVRERQSAAWWEVLHRLAELVLPGPVQTAWRRAGPDRLLEIILVPTGALYGFPFAALHLDGLPLLARARLVVTPSLRMSETLADGWIERPVTGRVLGYAHPALPGGEEEMVALQAEFGDRFERIHAAHDLVSRLADDPGCDLLSVAAHGADGTGGLRQQLHLADDLNLLAAGIIDELRLAPVTVFGACWLGRMQDVPGADALGLPIACLVKGAASFVGGLYAMHDGASADVLADLYAELAAGATPAEALRRAQLERYSTGSAGSPPPIREWAGYSCIGLPAPPQSFLV